MRTIILICLCLPFYLLSQNLLPSIGISTLPADSDSVCTIIPRNQGNPWISLFMI